MKIAQLVCISDGEVDGDVRTFDISTEDGRAKAIIAWKDRIKETWEADSNEEMLSRIEEGIINDFSYSCDGNSFQLFWGNLE
jgi:hypothetical protein